MSKEEKLKARKIAYRTWALSKLAGMNKTGKDTGNEEQRLIAAATNSELDIEEIRILKVKDKWEARLKKDVEKGTFKKEIEVEKQKTKKHMKEVASVKGNSDKIFEVLEELKISEKHRLFIMYYLQNYNSTQAALKVGYSKNTASTRGHSILRREDVQIALKQVKRLMQEDLYLSAHDILNEYKRIAFADITDYVTFNGRSVQMKNSDQVDGRIITEVKQGKDGITIKLADKMKAMEKLERLFDLIPDKKLELDREKFDWTKEQADKAGNGETGNRVVIVNDIR